MCCVSVTVHHHQHRDLGSLQAAVVCVVCVCVLSCFAQAPWFPPKPLCVYIGQSFSLWAAWDYLISLLGLNTNSILFGNVKA